MKHKIIQTTWNAHNKELSEIRRKVFINEQHVPEELEWDKDDETSIHFLALDQNNNPLACARIKPDGHIGRMAVLKEFRNKGIGSTILIAIVDMAKRNNIKKLYLHAQTSAITFYSKYEFTICSAEFMDAGIPHKTMERNILS
jgi:predicted GNAT family N-acyltransferase